MERTVADPPIQLTSIPFAPFLLAADPMGSNGFRGSFGRSAWCWPCGPGRLYSSGCRSRSALLPRRPRGPVHRPASVTDPLRRRALRRQSKGQGPHHWPQALIARRGRIRHRLLRPSAIVTASPPPRRGTKGSSATSSIASRHGAANSGEEAEAEYGDDVTEESGRRKREPSAAAAKPLMCLIYVRVGLRSPPGPSPCSIAHHAPLASHHVPTPLLILFC